MGLGCKNGGVRCHSLQTVDATPHSDYGYNKTYCCRIDEVFYADSPENTGNLCPSQKANIQIQYTVTILEGEKQGSQIFAVKDGETRGDGGNYHVRVRKKTTAKKDGPDADSPTNTDGEYVLVTFIGGCPTAPMIIGTVPHPKHSADTPKMPTDPDSDITEVKVVNGVKTTTYVSGKHVIEIVPVYDADGNVANQSAVGTSTTIAADGSVTTTTGSATQTMDKSGKCTTTGSSVETTASSSMSTKCDGTMTQKCPAFNLNSDLTKIGGGGPCTARIGDQVMVTGTDSNGDSHVLMGVIIGGSSLTLIGG